MTMNLPISTTTIAIANPHPVPSHLLALSRVAASYPSRQATELAQARISKKEKKQQKVAGKVGST